MSDWLLRTRHTQTEATDERQLSERDICSKYTNPALKAAGSDLALQVWEELSLTDGRVIEWGMLCKRGGSEATGCMLF